MSQHFSSMLEHLKMGNRKPSNAGATAETSTQEPSSQQPQIGNGEIASAGGSGGGPNSEKSSISALIQKFSSSCTTHQTPSGDSNNNHNNGGGGVDSKVNNANDRITAHQHRQEGGSCCDQVDCATITTRANEDDVHPKAVVATKVNNTLSVHGEENEKASGGGRKGSDSGLRAISDDNKHHGNLKNGQLINSSRKLSADFRARDLLCGEDAAGRHANHSSSKPFRVKNLANKCEAIDVLHTKTNEKIYCSTSLCQGSILYTHLVGVEPRKTEVLLEQAKDFQEQYFTSIKRLNSPAHKNRLQQIQKEVEETGTYQLSETELTYGAKLAWRNAYRCIGRIQWSKLQLFDCRAITTTSGMFEALCNHVKYATNKGNLRSAITIFGQRTDGTHDFRIWNNQLISYCGYKMPDGSVLGDPINVELTELCFKLGWKGKPNGPGAWDILPMVLSANGHDPEYFEYPEDLIMQVPLEHPTYEWFGEMGLRWYALPAVANMMFDCGGIQFPATAFSGWYMATEIGCRNLCDTHRRNLLEPIGKKMGLETRNPTSLWKDKALVEINIAVLHSFQLKNVTIVDHHTASESFMKHLDNENKLRNGCPADWLWIVPPMSGSATPVYHQEMLSYILKPSFDYQEPPQKTHVWKKGRDPSKNKKPKRKFHFKQIARAVKFTSKLFGRALSRRIKATILYATETGRSEQYGKQFAQLLSHAFNAQVCSMQEYDISSLEHEALLFVVASTFGNGDPPENGEVFAHDLCAMKLQETAGDTANTSTNGLEIPVPSRSFIKQNSRVETRNKGAKLDRLDSMRGPHHLEGDENFGPLSNVRYAVFGLGSSAYPNFCAFGKYVDNLLGELGGERLMKLGTGDEMCGQEQSFHEWAREVFKVACDTFCLETDEKLYDTSSIILKPEIFTSDNLRLCKFQPPKQPIPLSAVLDKYHNRKTMVGKIKRAPTSLQDITEVDKRYTILVEICSQEINYEPGDHIGVFPKNSAELVDGIIKYIDCDEDPDIPVQLEVLKEIQTQNQLLKRWEVHEKLPALSIRSLLLRFLDITTPPSRQFLAMMSPFCTNKCDKTRMDLLANDQSAYEEWRHARIPHLLEVFQEFPSCNVPASLLLVSLMPLQPRFYSISSSLQKHPNEVHLTVAIVKYQTENGKGPLHYGVCSNYLNELQETDEVIFFLRSAANFHMPKNPERPVILVGPGTGIAPFRSFWQQWEYQLMELGQPLPKVWLFFGCRRQALDLYADEKDVLLQRHVFDRQFLALSREPSVCKTYVQDLLLEAAEDIYKMIVEDQGFVYVCGDVTMAENVYETLRSIIATKENRSENEVEKFLLSLRDENRYNEDIFGITLRTAEVQNKSRQSALSRLSSQFVS